MAEKRRKNISERKKMEEELAESRKDFKSLFNTIPDPVVIVDTKGKILEITDRAEEITGIKKEELLGKNFLRAKIPFTTKSKVILIKHFLTPFGVKVAPFEVEVLTKDGKKIPFEVNSADIEYRGKPVIMVVFRDITERKRAKEELRKHREHLEELVEERTTEIKTINEELQLDITERKRAEEALRESEERYRTVFTGTHDAMWIVKVKGKGEFIYEEVNPEYSNFTGLDRKDAVGKRLSEIFERETADKISRDYGRVVKEKKPLKKEQHLKFPTGEKWDLATLTPLLNKNGNVDKIIGSGKDITLRKMFEKRIKAEREVYQSIARAANQSRSVEELCELALEGIRTAIKYDMADLSIYRESENALFSAAQVGFPEDLYRETTKQQDLEGPGVAAQVARTRKSVYIDDMKTSELASHRHDLIMKYDISTMYTVPLVSRDKLQGVLQVITSGGRELSKENREVLDTISEELAGGIAKAKIEERLVTAKEAFGWLAQG